MNTNELSHLIINYLKRSPDACDNLEGIADWWLQFERIEYTVDEVQSVLDDLVRKGLLEKVEINGRKRFYSICKDEQKNV